MQAKGSYLVLHGDAQTQQSTPLFHLKPRRVCVLVLRVCLQSASQTACKDHKDKEEDVFTPLWVFHFLFDHLLLSYTHSSFYTLSSLLSPRFLPVTSSFCGLVCECAGAWVRILCKRRLTHLFIVVLNGDESVCVCVCALTSTEDQLTLKHILLFEFVCTFVLTRSQQLH